MQVYLYAICRGDVDAPVGEGLHGEPLRVVRANGLAALVGHETPATGSEDELWEHEDAVERLMQSHDLLPARFGTTLSSDAAVRDLLAQRSHELGSALRRVAGASELSVRAIWCEASVPGATPSGADYMQARAATARRAAELADTLEARLAPLSRARRPRPAVAPIAFASAYLVARERTTDFMAALGRLDRETHDAMLTCTGPWPPYSFTPGEETHRA